MPYLRVECPICKIAWNYYDEKWETDPLRATTAVQYQGCVCPRCGSIGFIPGKATKDVDEVSV